MSSAPIICLVEDGHSRAFGNKKDLATTRSVRGCVPSYPFPLCLISRVAPFSTSCDFINAHVTLSRLAGVWSLISKPVMTCTSSFCYGARYCWCVRARRQHHHQTASSGSLSRHCGHHAPSHRSQSSCIPRTGVHMWLQTWDPPRGWELVEMEAVVVTPHLRQLSVEATRRHTQHHIHGVCVVTPHRAILLVRHFPEAERGTLPPPQASSQACTLLVAAPMAQRQTISALSYRHLSGSPLPTAAK